MGETQGSQLGRILLPGSGKRLRETWLEGRTKHRKCALGDMVVVGKKGHSVADVIALAMLALDEVRADEDDVVTSTTVLPSCLK